MYLTTSQMPSPDSAHICSPAHAHAHSGHRSWLMKLLWMDVPSIQRSYQHILSITAAAVNYTYQIVHRYYICNLSMSLLSAFVESTYEHFS